MHQHARGTPALFDPTSTAYKILSTSLAGYEGAPVDKLSTLYIETLYYMILGGLSKAHQEPTVHLASVQGGNALLVETITKRLGDHVHCNMPLTALERSGTSYQLTFADGQKITADIVVLAMPCPTYRHIEIAPEVIPADKLSSIRNVQYGTNAKILVPLIRSNESQQQSALMNDRLLAGFIQHPTACTLYFVGNNGKFDSISIEHTYQLNVPALAAAFGKSALPAQAPVVAADQQFAHYNAPVGYSWSNDPYALGSFSCIAPGQEQTLTHTETIADETVRSLFAPINNGIYFAGEHASILFECAGTLEAACESGERAACMIKKQLTLNT